MGSNGAPLQTQPNPIIVLFAVPGEGMLNETNVHLSTGAWFDMADQRKGWVLPIKEYLLHEAATLTWTGGSDLIFSLSFFSSFSIIASNHNILPVSPI